MSDLFLEVDEALKQERMEKLWKEYGSLIITLIIFVILATAAYAGYKNWNENVKTTQTTKLLEAKNSANPQALLNLAPDLRPDLATIARLRAAELLIQEEKLDEAKNLYGDIANNKKIDNRFKKLAQLAQLRLMEQDQAKEALDGLEALANDETNPWRHHARLEAALVQVHKFQNYKAAREHLAVLLSTNPIPPTLSQKANSLDLLYKMQETTNIAPAAGTENEKKPAEQEQQ